MVLERNQTTSVMNIAMPPRMVAPSLGRDAQGGAQAGAREAAVRAARGLAGDRYRGAGVDGGGQEARRGGGERWRRAIQVQRRRIGGRARTMIMVSVVVGAILLYLRRNGRIADDRAGWCDCCSVRLQAPATSSRGGEGGSGLGPWETRRAAPWRGMCVCAEEAAASGGRWEEGLRRTKKLCR